MGVRGGSCLGQLTWIGSSGKSHGDSRSRSRWIETGQGSRLPLEKAFFALADSPGRSAVPVLFNPPEYGLTKSNHFAQIAIPGLDAQLIQFVRGENRTLDVDLFFDTTESRGSSEGAPGQASQAGEPGSRSFAAGTDVREVTDQLTKFMEIDPQTHTPPICLFGWGQGHVVRCVIESATQRFTRFLENGTPVRATLKLTLREVISAPISTQEDTELSRQHPSAHSRTWLVRDGDTLWAIAGAEYGDSREWKRIASANGIEDPKKMRIGTVLVIPER